MNKLYMMIGLPGSGKSTISRKLSKKENAVIVSSDDIRKEIFGNEKNQSDNKKVFKIAEERVKEKLKIGNVIYDATNINYKKRMEFLQKIKDVEKIAFLVLTPYRECLLRNEQRERRVPISVIKRMYCNFYVPQYYEGFDNIMIFNSSSISLNFNTDELFKRLNYISQDNPHHTLTIGKHCLKVASEFDKEEQDILFKAALYHDIGKEFTKQFVNCKGEKTDIAHYYNHEKVSAYKAMFYLTDEPKWKVLYICKLIQWHMLLHNNLSEKGKKKYIDLLGQECWKDLELLYQADLKAK